MHISDGVLPPAVWVSGCAGAALAVGVALRGYREDRALEIGLLAAVFFVASSIHVPLPGAEVHLMLTGLVGIILGTLAPIAILVALFLQAVLLGEGGLTALGVNTLTMSGGALVAALVYRGLRSGRRPVRPEVAGGIAATSAVLTSGGLFVLAMAVGDQALATVARVAFVLHLPVAAVEGVVTAFAVGFLHRVRPEMVDARRHPAR